MSYILRVFNIVISLFLATTLISCGGGGTTKGSKTSVDIIPPKPIVITGPTKDSLGNDVPGAWYRFSVSITNPTDEELTIVALQVETTTVDENGQSTTTDTTFSPTQYNFQFSENIQCKYSSFGTIAANSSANLGLASGGNPECTGIAVFIVGGNSTGPNGNNFRYRVKVKPLGWFGPEGLSTTASFDRYEKTETFFTR